MGIPRLGCALATGKKKGLGRLFAASVAAAVAVTASGLPAMADVHQVPADPAEAAASVVNSSLAGKDLLGGALSHASFPTKPGPDNQPLNVGVLGSQVVSLGNLSLPVDQLIDFGQISALQSKSEATSAKDAHAISGLAGADGAVTLDGKDSDFGAARIDLLSLFKKLGLDTLSNLALDQADLIAGAGGAKVTAKDGVIQDPDGVGGLGRYRVAEATLLAKSRDCCTVR